MISEGAQGLPEPRSKINCAVVKRYSRFKSILRSYFFVVCFLFLVVVLLGANNIIIYESYRDIQREFDSVFSKVKSINTYKQDITQENVKLQEENANLSKKLDEIAGRNQEIITQLQALRKQNDELVRKNKELVEDNLALQNSLKKAASVGIKPQNYTSFNGIETRGDIERGTYIGSFMGTAYTPSIGECGKNDGITNSGKPIIPGISLAIDDSYWPFGTVFYIKGLGYAVAMDTGSAIKGKYRFDFAVFDKKFAKTLGARRWDVYLVKLGDGKVRGVEF